MDDGRDELDWRRWTVLVHLQWCIFKAYYKGAGAQGYPGKRTVLYTPFSTVLLHPLKVRSMHLKLIPGRPQEKPPTVVGR